MRGGVKGYVSGVLPVLHHQAGCLRTVLPSFQAWSRCFIIANGSITGETGYYDTDGVSDGNHVAPGPLIGLDILCAQDKLRQACIRPENNRRAITLRFGRRNRKYMLRDMREDLADHTISI